MVRKETYCFMEIIFNFVKTFFIKKRVHFIYGNRRNSETQNKRLETGHNVETQNKKLETENFVDLVQCKHNND